MKRLCTWLSMILCMMVMGLPGIFMGTVQAQSLGGILNAENDLFKPLLEENDLGEKHFDLGINAEQSMQDNLKQLFYPSSDGANLLWRAIRIITVAVLVGFLIWTGASFLLYGTRDEEELKAARRSIIYLIYGAALVFLATWILGTALDIGGVKGITGDDGFVAAAENNFFIVVLSFLKAAAFFVAIIFLVRYGYKMMLAFDQDDKIAAARTGMFNVIMALIFIKVIDYLYFIAQDGDFTSGAADFIVRASRFVGYIAGFLIFLAIIYAGYLMITSRGDDSQIDKGKNILKAVFIVTLMIMLFLLIVFQVFSDVF